MAYHIRDTIPQKVVIEMFGGMGAISPENYQILLKQLADDYGATVEEIEPYVREVLKEAPCPLD